jgi:Cu+-exporting ATPase
MNAIHQEDIIRLSVKGMTCGHCAMNVTKALEESGALHIKVDHGKGLASFKTNPNGIDAIISKLNSLGYPAALQQKSAQTSALVRGLEAKFAISLILTLPLMAHMFSSAHIWHNPWLQLALSIPVVTIGIFHFGLSALGSLKRRTLNMDVLIFIGSVSAFIYSLIGTLFSLGENFLFYETAAAIVTFVLLGNLLEKTALAKTTKAIEDLHSLRPQLARRVNSDKHTQEISTNELKIGDLILIHAGETIPADGIIESGHAEINEAMITGESVPVTKEVGAQVIGSTILIKGPITVRVKSVGESSVLYSIIKLVEHALAERPHIHQFADKVSAIFVPVILTISIITLAVSWGVLGLTLSESFLRSIAVLVIACPCAMGLATPTAIAVSVGKATKMGILVKSGRALEQLNGVKTVLFDKTGTLTTGAFSISKIEPLSLSIDESKSIILALEENSSHPIAKSLSKAFAGTKKSELRNIKEERGVGMRGEDPAGSQYELRGENHSSSLVLLKDGQPACRLTLQDELRPNAKSAISAIKARGLTTILVSGDSKNKCEQIARELGIDECYSQMKPEEKLKIISEITTKTPTAFVGDGINDAPALAAATVGISLSSATDVAVNSAHLVLLQNDLSALVRAFSAAENTLRAIKQNLFWALAYNIIAVPAAAIGYMSPILAAFSMAFSDVIVIGNSLRLKIQKH